MVYSNLLALVWNLLIGSVTLSLPTGAMSDEGMSIDPLG